MLPAGTNTSSLLVIRVTVVRNVRSGRQRFRHEVLTHKRKTDPSPKSEPGPLHAADLAGRLDLVPCRSDALKGGMNVAQGNKAQGCANHLEAILFVITIG